MQASFSTNVLHPDLEILYSDEQLIAINKPAGLLVHRSAIDFHESQNAQEHLQNQIGRRVFPAHRLDKPTSGVLLFSFDKVSAANLSLQFKNQQISKQYVAVVRGYTDTEGLIKHSVKDKDAPQKPRKEATTKYKTLAQIELPVRVDSSHTSSRYSVVQIEPLSGRRHQIRQHMKHISHPLIGDTSYGKSAHNRFFRDHFASNRLLLHAERLVALHPKTGKSLTIKAQRYDDQFNRVLIHSGWAWNNHTRKHPTAR